ncbi:MAG: hypothetical protein AMXMBFR4_07370 [Candidatus Hydrogenedentota bacterium]
MVYNGVVGRHEVSVMGINIKVSRMDRAAWRGAIAMAIFGCATLAVAETTAQAKLLETSRDHGEVFVGTNVEGAFFVENTGTKPFTITEVKASCSCTTAIVTKGETKPGEKAEVHYEIHSKAPTHRSISMRVQTEPPLGEPLVFTGSATFKPFIEIDPKDVAIEIPAGTKVEHRVPLRIVEKAGEVKILDATVRLQDFKTELERDASGAPSAILVRSIKPLPAGRRVVRVALSYERGEPGLQEVALTITAVPDVKVTPSPMIVRFEGNAKEVTIPVTLTHTKNTAFRITQVTGTNCTIRKPELPATEAAEHAIEITFVRDDATSSRRGQLLFKLEGSATATTADVVLPRALAPSTRPRPGEGALSRSPVP